MKQIQVAVGIVLNKQNQVFISKRRDDAYLGGLWEFPGGKLNSNESFEEGLMRELKEEINIMPGSGEFLCEKQHRGDDRIITLRFFLVKDYEGSPSANEGQKIKWVEVAKLEDYSMPPVNQSVLSVLRDFLNKKIVDKNLSIGENS